MSVRKTSLDAYNELQVNGKANTQRGKILSFLLAHSNYVDEPSISKNNVNGIKPILSVQEDFFQPDTLMHQHHF